jgi:hypothetical protein
MFRPMGNPQKWMALLQKFFISCFAAIRFAQIYSTIMAISKNIPPKKLLFPNENT